MAIAMKPLGITHFLMGLTWGSVLVGINGIEFYLLGKSTTELDVLWIVMQNIGIASANSYYLSKIDMTPQGLTESTSK
ncbi:MAG: hypothetical protein QW478_10170 [Candidatus Micrarchaeaceae archaeon]